VSRFLDAANRRPVDVTPVWSRFAELYPGLTDLLARSGEVARGLAGFEVGALARRHRKPRHIPLMFLSGEAENDARARELGAIACLAKPFDPVALSTLIASTLRPAVEGAWA